MKRILPSFCHSILTYFEMKEDNKLEFFLRNTTVRHNIYFISFQPSHYTTKLSFGPLKEKRIISDSENRAK